MSGRKNILRVAAASAALGSVAAFSSMPAWAAPPANLPPGLDPAHHSTDVNDPDPAHHRPFFLCSASTATCVLTPIAGFNLDGTPVGSGLPPRPVMLPPGYSTDPAHHSTDLNDPDPAHHQPTLEFDEASGTFILTPIPGFDLQGFRVTTTTPAPAPGDGDDGDGTVGNPGDDNPRTGNPGNGNDNGNGNGNPNPGNPVRPFFR